MSHQRDIKNGIHPRPCGMINLSNIISYGRGTLPNLIDKNAGKMYDPDVVHAFNCCAEEIKSILTC